MSSDFQYLQDDDDRYDGDFNSYPPDQTSSACRLETPLTPEDQLAVLHAFIDQYHAEQREEQNQQIATYRSLANQLLEILVQLELLQYVYASLPDADSERKGGKMPSGIATRFLRVLRKAVDGDEASLDQLREQIVRFPEAWQCVCTLTAQAEAAVIDAVGGPTTMLATELKNWLVTATCDAMPQSLNPSQRVALERSLVGGLFLLAAHQCINARRWHNTQLAEWWDVLKTVGNRLPQRGNWL